MLLSVAFILTEILASHLSNDVSDLSASSSHWQSKNVFSIDFAIMDRSQILPFELIILLKHVQTFFSLFHIQNSGLCISSIPIFLFCHSGILSGIYALIRSGILFWHLFRFFLWHGRCRTSTASASGFEIYNMLFLNLRKNNVGNLGCCNSVVIRFFFAVHQCAFWNANLRFFCVHRCGFWNTHLCFFIVTSVLLLVRTFRGRRKQNNACFRRFSFGFTLLRDFWAT